MMSFLGSVGYCMKGSGIEELFEEVYAANSIPHMLSGKAVSRALRAHFMAESALVALLLEQLCSNESIDFNFLYNLYNKAMEMQLNEEEIWQVLTEEPYAELLSAIETLKKRLCLSSRTATLWVLYIYYIYVSDW